MDESTVVKKDSGTLFYNHASAISSPSLEKKLSSHACTRLSMPLHIHLALNLHLDSPRLRIRRRLKSLDRILQIKAMRNQPMQIHNPALHQPNGSGPRIGIAVLELQVDLLRAQPHKRKLHLRLADTDDKDLAAEFDAVDGRVDAAFHAGAFQRDGGLHAACEVDDLLPGVLFAHASFHLEGAHAGHEFLGEIEPALVDVGDDEGLRSCGRGAEQRDQPDGSSPTNQYWVAQLDSRPLHSRKRNAQGLQERAILEAHIADFVAPDGWVVDVASQQPIYRWGGEETHIQAAIVAAREAGLALVADDVWFDGNAVSDLEVLDGRVLSDDDAS